MNTTILMAMTLNALALGLLTWLLGSTDRSALRRIRANLGRGLEQEEQKAPVDRLLSRLGQRLTPPFYLARLDRLLTLAGRPVTMPLGRLLAAKPAAAAAGGVVGLLLTSIGSGPLLSLTALALPIAAYFLPDLLLMSQGQKRQQAIQLELANTLDQMLIAVEAGLGFEAAMARAGENGRGPLADELIRTLQDMQVGRSRRESYLALADRTNVLELRSFVQAVVQADAYGIAIGKVLRVQAKTMRAKRRQRAEEKAMKLPVMILFPLLFFIFPVLFIAILGPAVINAVSTLGGQ